MPLPEEYYGKVKLKELIETIDYAMENATVHPQDLPVASVDQLGVVALAEEVEVGNEKVITSNLLSISLDNITIPEATLDDFGTVKLSDSIEEGNTNVPTSEVVFNYVEDNITPINNKILYGLSNITPSTLSFDMGRTEYFLMNGNTNHSAWITWLNAITGVTNEAFNYSFKISTTKVLSSGTSRTIQEITVYLAFNNSTYNKVMDVTRIFNGSTLANTRIDAVNNMGYGTPTITNCFALPGSIYTDISTGVQYKATGTPTSGNFVTNIYTVIPTQTKTLTSLSMILTRTSSGWTSTTPYGSGISYVAGAAQFTFSYATAFTTPPLITVSTSAMLSPGSKNVTPIISSNSTSSTVVFFLASDGGAISFSDVPTGSQVHFSASTYL